MLPVSFTPRRLRHARGSRWRLCGEFCEPAEVLGDRGVGELSWCAFRAAKSKASQLEDAFQAGEKHLDALALAARLLEGGGSSKGTARSRAPSCLVFEFGPLRYNAG